MCYSSAGDVTSRLSTLNAAIIKLSEQNKKLQSNKRSLEEKLKQSTARIEHTETGEYFTYVCIYVLKPRDSQYMYVCVLF